MKKILLFIGLFISVSVMCQTVPGYVPMNDGFNFLRTYHRGITIVSGSSPALLPTQTRMTGGLYIDSVGTDSGYYYYFRGNWKRLADFSQLSAGGNDSAYVNYTVSGDTMFWYRDNGAIDTLIFGGTSSGSGLNPTQGYGITYINDSTVRADTLVLATRSMAQKKIDSLATLISGGGGITTVGTINSQSKSSNGAVISGASIYQQTVDATYPGLMTPAQKARLDSNSYIAIDKTLDSLAWYKNDSTLYIKSINLSVPSATVTKTITDSTINYAVTGISGGSQTLQSVTDIDSITNNSITIRTKDSVGTRYAYDWTTGTFGGLWTDNTATGTLTASAGKTAIAGTLAYNLSNSVSLPFYMGVENFTITQRLILPARSNTTFGFGIRISGTVGSVPDMFFHFYTTDTSSYIAYTVGASLPTYSTSPNSRGGYTFIYQAGDTVIATIQKVNRLATATLTNIRNGSTMKLTIPECTVTVGTLSMYFYSAADLIGSFNLTYNEIHQTKIAWNGDSNQWGVSANSKDGAYPSQVGSGLTGGYVNMSAPFERALEGTYRIDDLLQVDPQIAVWGYGVNVDVNIDSFSKRTCRWVEAALANGAKVVLLSLIPQTASSVLIRNDTLMAIKNRYNVGDNVRYIDITTPLLAASGTAMHALYNVGDGVHINQNGHNVVASVIKQKLSDWLTYSSPLTVGSLPTLYKPSFTLGVENGVIGRVLGDSLNSYIKNIKYTAGILNGQQADIHIDGTGNIGGRFQANGNGTDANPNLLVDAGTVTVPSFSASSGHFTVTGGQTSVTSNWFQFLNNAYIRTTSSAPLPVRINIAGPAAGTIGLHVTTENQQPANNYIPFAVGTADTIKVRFDRWGGAVFNDRGEASAMFRIEGDTDTAALVVNAVTDFVGIGTIFPREKLDVATGLISYRGATVGTSIDSVLVLEDGRIKSINSSAFGGGGGSPGGSNTHVQYNNSSAFGGGANFVFNGNGVGIGGVAANSSYPLYVSGSGAGAYASGPIFSTTTNSGSGSSPFGLYVQPTITEFSSGTHPSISSVSIDAPIVTSGAATVTNAQSLYVNGAPSATVTGKNRTAWFNSGITAVSSLEAAITSTSSNITLGDHYTVLVDASGAARTITLPAAAGTTGQIYIVKKSDSSGNTVTIDGNASETIDGATTKVISTQWAGMTIQSNGTAWFIISTF